MKLSAEDSRFLEAYFRAEYACMLAVAKTKLANSQLAEEVVQDTFLTAINRIEKFRSSPNPVGWLYLVLNNHILHENRDWHMLARRLTALTEREASSCGSFEDSSLPADCDKELHLLRKVYIDGCSMEILAAEAGCSPGAMKTRVYRAKQHVRARMLQEEV